MHIWQSETHRGHPKLDISFVSPHKLLLSQVKLPHLSSMLVLRLNDKFFQDLDAINTQALENRCFRTSA